MVYKGTVAESLMPTFENVTDEFITSTMNKIYFSPDKANLRFHFIEPEAVAFIQRTLQKHSEKYNWSVIQNEKVLQAVDNPFSDELSVMTVSNYKEFFESLRQFYEKDIELYFKRTGGSGFPVWEMRNCFEQIWLRATPEDFNYPENFLRKQVQMIKDRTFEKYDKETCLGKVACLDDNILCIQNQVARTWDETSQEMHITIYDNSQYDNKEAFYRSHYTLPVIRYGIYERDGKKICHIGSIQNKDIDERKEAVRKKVDRVKYKVNAGVDEQDTKDVEPKNLIALSIFINLLSKEGITEIEAPSLYVLDYDYHIKKGEMDMMDLDIDWPQEQIDRFPERYAKLLNSIKRTYGNEDVISKVKSEKFMRTFTRLLQHYPNGRVNSYPSELDSSIHVTIPKVKSKNEINNEMLREMYTLVEKYYEEIEI